MQLFLLFSIIYPRFKDVSPYIGKNLEEFNINIIENFIYHEIALMQRSNILIDTDKLKEYSLE